MVHTNAIYEGDHDGQIWLNVDLAQRRFCDSEIQISDSLC